MQNRLLFSFLTLLAFCPALLRADGDSLTPPLPGQERFRLKFRTGYYYTEDNYLTRFQTEPLQQTLGGGGVSPPFFHYMDAGLSLGYVPAKWLELELFATGFWFAQSGNGDRLYFSTPHIKRVGGLIRTQHLIAGVFGFIPEILVSSPFFPINYSTESPITDDGEWHVTPSLWLYGVLFDIVHPFAYTGFKWRGHPLSSLFQWKAGLMLKADIAEIGFYSHGFWSVTKDLSSSLLGDRISLLKRVNAGSLRFFSANPGVIGARGWLAWHFPHLTLRLSGNMDLTGVSYSQGYGALVEIIIRMGKVRKTAVEAIFSEKDSGFTPQVVTDSADLEKAFKSADKALPSAWEEDQMEQDMEEALKQSEQEEEMKME